MPLLILFKLFVTEKLRLLYGLKEETARWNEEAVNLHHLKVFLSFWKLNWRFSLRS